MRCPEIISGSKLCREECPSLAPGHLVCSQAEEREVPWVGRPRTLMQQGCWLLCRGWLSLFPDINKELIWERREDQAAKKGEEIVLALWDGRGLSLEVC